MRDEEATQKEPQRERQTPVVAAEFLVDALAAQLKMNQMIYATTDIGQAGCHPITLLEGQHGGGRKGWTSIYSSNQLSLGKRPRVSPFRRSYHSCPGEECAMWNGNDAPGPPIQHQGAWQSNPQFRYQLLEQTPGATMVEHLIAWLQCQSLEMSGCY